MKSSFSTSVSATATALAEAASLGDAASLAAVLGAAAVAAVDGAVEALGVHAARAAAPPVRPAAHRNPRRLTFVRAIRWSSWSRSWSAIALSSSRRAGFVLELNPRGSGSRPHANGARPDRPVLLQVRPRPPLRSGDERGARPPGRSGPRT